MDMGHSDRGRSCFGRVRVGLGVALMVALAGSVAQAQEEDPFAPEPEPLVPGGRTPSPGNVERPGVAAAAGPDSMVDVNLGVTMLQRSFTLDSATAGLELSSSLFPTVHVGLEAFPLRDSEGVLGRLGLTGTFGYGLDTTVIDEGGVIRKVPTRVSEVGVAAVYRHRLGESLVMEGDTGLYILNFVLSNNPFYSSTTYQAWQLSARATYTATPWLDVVGGLQLFPLVGLGSSEAEFGQDSSTFGAAFQLAAQADVVSGLYIHGGYSLRAFSSSFTGEGDRGLDAVVTTDIFHALSLWVGYRLE